MGNLAVLLLVVGVLAGLLSYLGVLGGLGALAMKIAYVAVALAVILFIVGLVKGA